MSINLTFLTQVHPATIGSLLFTAVTIDDPVAGEAITKMKIYRI